MPHANISLDPGLTAIERALCKKYDGQMMFTGVVAALPGFDIRTFEYLAYDDVGDRNDGLRFSRQLLPSK
jgi:hypothetical protein